MQNYLHAIILTVVLILSGCANSQSTLKAQVKKERFQSVTVENAQLVQNGEDKASCVICGMHLPTFYKTNHAAQTKYGKRQYCSLHCVVHDNELNKTDLTNLQVVDTNSLKFIDAQKAFYVVGSTKPGTMSRVSKYAFANEAEAKAFAKAFGGEVMDFNKAYDEAIKDFTQK